MRKQGSSYHYHSVMSGSKRAVSPMIVTPQNYAMPEYTIPPFQLSPDSAPPCSPLFVMVVQSDLPKRVPHLPLQKNKRSGRLLCGYECVVEIQRTFVGEVKQSECIAPVRRKGNLHPFHRAVYIQTR